MLRGYRIRPKHRRVIPELSVSRPAERELRGPGVAQIPPPEDAKERAWWIDAFAAARATCTGAPDWPV